MQFFKAFSYTAGAVLGAYCGMKVIDRIESELRARRQAKKEEQKHEQKQAAAAA